MYKRIIILGMILLPFALEAQPFSLEAMAGNQYLFYQHNFQKSFRANGRWGVKHLANYIMRYEQEPEKGGMPSEMMNQLYLTYSLNRHFSAGIGGFYTQVTGFRASFTAQYVYHKKNLLWVLSPRVDIWNQGAFEMFTMLEYNPMLKGETRLYTRFQMMTSHGPYTHNRTYQQLRLGIQMRQVQFGAAVNLDEYGKRMTLKTNAGVFIKTLI